MLIREKLEQICGNHGTAQLTFSPWMMCLQMAPFIAYSLVSQDTTGSQREAEALFYFILFLVQK